MAFAKNIPSIFQSNQYHYENVYKTLEMYSNYEKFLRTRDLQAETSGHYLEKYFSSI